MKPSLIIENDFMVIKTIDNKVINGKFVKATEEVEIPLRDRIGWDSVPSIPATEYMLLNKELIQKAVSEMHNHCIQRLKVGTKHRKAPNDCIYYRNEQGTLEHFDDQAHCARLLIMNDYDRVARRLPVFALEQICKALTAPQQQEVRDHVQDILVDRLHEVPAFIIKVY